MTEKKHVRVVAALIRRNIDGENRILITRRPDNSDFGGFWEFPGGKVEAGESDKEALARELIEELALSVDVGDVYYSNVFEYEKFVMDFHLYNCLATGSEIQTVGISGFEWVRPDQLEKYRFPPADAIVVSLLAGADT